MTILNSPPSSRSSPSWRDSRSAHRLVVASCSCPCLPFFFTWISATHRSFARLRDRDLFRRCRLLCERRILQHSHWHVPGNRDHIRRVARSLPGHRSRPAPWRSSSEPSCSIRVSFPQAASAGPAQPATRSLATRLRMNGSFPISKASAVTTSARPAGFSLMFGAGALSGLLGIGSAQ